ncbi:hypothetical protein K435DRAFT_317491, partial [Dendrothele bispora CBS 962.96]
MLLPKWTPHPHFQQEESLKPVLDRLQSLHLPAVCEGNGPLNKPNLLLHDLGGSLYSNSNNQKRIQGLFGDATHKLLVNPSGSGKTRIVLEGLCQYWGLYLTCQTISSSAQTLSFGSTDVPRIISQLHLQPGFTSFLPDNIAETFELLQKNWDITNHWFSAALLARIVLFHRFLTNAILENIPSGPDLRRRWLLAQIQPNLIFGFDVLDRLTQGIGTVSDIHSIKTSLSRHWEEVAALLYTLEPSLETSGEKPTLFVVIDEAQDGVSQLPEAFMSGPPAPVKISRKKRPVLRQLLFALTSALEGMGDQIIFSHIVTGTGISKKMLEDAVSSAT